MRRLLTIRKQNVQGKGSMMGKKTDSVSRREFLKSTSVLSAAAVLGSTGGLFAQGNETIRVALVGCGGRGAGALENFIEAAKTFGMNVQITGLADFFKDRVLTTAGKHNVSEDLCFEGADAYKKAVATDADVVILATPPNFRPVHLETAVSAGKHVFMEKPVAVDPPGARRIIEIGEQARAKKLSIVSGTQRRHEASYLQTKRAIDDGAIGTLVGGQVWWCEGRLWYKKRQPGESDADYMIRNWVSFAEMSGDHIVEQHIHNIDVANWYLGAVPKQCVGFGGRARRQTGNQYDFFSVDFEYADGVHIHSMCRQIKGGYNRVAEFFIGTEGTAAGGGPVRNKNGKKVQAADWKGHENPYVQEHIDLLRSIREGKGENDAKTVAESNLTAIMGRISAYTGQLIRWSDLTDPQSHSPWYSLTLKPTAMDFEIGNLTAPKDDVVPVPGAPA